MERSSTPDARDDHHHLQTTNQKSIYLPSSDDFSRRNRRSAALQPLLRRWFLLSDARSGRNPLSSVNLLFFVRTTVGDIESVLQRFVSSSVDPSMDCAFASVVYGGADGILARLLEMKVWFEEQTEYHFYSCSVLMGFEREAAEKGREGRVMMRLVDFAHVLDGRGVIDLFNKATSI
ncbi:Inositol polyphosphate multikinase alpha [Acorus calamus]|uniref:Inositol polyphosphate multikinase n=1 Tax=Acorus calamus TaxID=4465 RepID=A0AAV9EIR6_ACOCL|nr:Inositol polyphosphate multikinase alpha [Acorus calamus]